MISQLRLILLTFLLLLALPAGATTPQRLTLDVRGNIASVQVPVGIVQVILEQHQGTSWKPLAVRHLAASATVRSLKFALPAGVKATQLRANGYGTAKFPARLTTATHSFQRPGPGQDDTRILDINAPIAPAPDDITGVGVETPVVESDIWKISGNQLFFFNQYRGLQVFDLTNPTTPQRTGTLRMAASGEQFYVLDAAGQHLALLGQSNSAERPGEATLFVLEINAGVPRQLAEIPLLGAVSDSRLIGNLLYVMSTTYSETDGTWQPETQLQTIDLTNPNAPVSRPVVRLTGSATALQAAGGYLLLTTDHYDGVSWYSTSRLHLFDLSATDGTPIERKSFDLKGQVQDKFKLSVVGTAAVATSLYWNHAQQETWIETFPLAGTNTTPLAQLELTAARGEQLHATRYDGNRLYVVTFLNTDPLFVVDLSDPAAPSISGALEIPGWSTYIEPLGDRLLTVGVESGRVAVSLFNVADPTAPTLLSRLPLGEEGSWSWSEANYDEKAVGYFPDAGIMLVPFQNYTEDGYVKAIQAIAVGRDKLTADALIVHDFDPRRGAVLGDYFVSISGQELLVLDRTKDTTGVPAVQLTLAWTTDRVIPLGEYLVQIEDGACNSGGLYFRMMWTCDNTAAMARITLAADPDQLISTIDLGAGRIVGSAVRDNRLYLAQWVSADDTQPAKLRTSILDMATPPQLPTLNTFEHKLTDVSEWDLNFAAAQLLWVNSSVLAWHVPAWQHWGWWGIAYNAAAQRDVASANLAALVCPLRNLNGTSIIVTPAIRITTTESFRSAAPARAQNGLLFLSFDTASADPNPAQPLVDDDGTVPWIAPTEIVQSWLQVVDLRTSTPIVRSPVSIPGALLSVDQVDEQGAILITDSESWDAANEETKRSVQAVAYDGVLAYQLDNRTISNSAGAPSASDGTRLFLATAASEPSVIALGYNASTGRLVQTGTWTLDAMPSSLASIDDALLAGSTGRLDVASVDATGNIAAAGAYAIPTNLWLQLERTAIVPGAALYIPAGAYGVEVVPLR